jgi:hypothetical protein
VCFELSIDTRTPNEGRNIMVRTFPRSVPAFVGSALFALPMATVVHADEDRDADESRPSITLDNPGDPNFNQLLGINDEGVIVGYFGDGTTVANNGCVLVPKNHYAVENYGRLRAGDSASQTQAIGVNNRRFPQSQVAVHGFIYHRGRFAHVDATGSSQTAAFNVMGTIINGVNDEGDIVGFYSDGTRVHGFVRYAGQF